MYGWQEYLVVSGVVALVVGFIAWHVRQPASWLYSAKCRLWDYKSSKN
jgi:glucose dehydrogenase